MAATSNRLRLPFLVNVCRLSACRQYHLTSHLLKRSIKAPKERKMLKGEALERHMEKKREGQAQHAVYKNAVSAIVQVFREDRRKLEYEKLDSEGAIKIQENLEKDQQSEKLALVAESNAELQRKRLIRMEKHRQDSERQREEATRAALQQQEELLQLRTAMVMQAIEDSKEFVTLSNLDEKINECLSTEVNYNFALAKDGSKVLSTKPPGNFEGAWRGPGPAAFKLGGYRSRHGEWDFVFQRLSSKR